MKIKKKVIWIILLVLCMSGCVREESTSPKEGKQITSELVQMDLNLLEQKMANKESFVVMISQSTCSHCITMKRTLVPYFREHKDIPFYEIEMDMLSELAADTNKNFARLQKILPEFSGGTPEFFYFKDGMVNRQKSGEMSEIGWNNFMIDCGFIEEEKKEEPSAGYPLAESDNFLITGINEAADRIQSGEEFYLMFASEERFSQSMSEKVKKYMEEKDIRIFLLNNSASIQPSTQEESERMNASVDVINKALKIEIAPSIFHIKEGKVVDTLKDNVSDKKMREWFKKQK